MWNEQKQILQAQLAPHERLLWSGQPRTGIVFRAADAFMIPFSLLWCGFAVFWEMGVLTTGAPFFFKLWGVPFVLAGLYFVFGRFIVDARQRAKTYYGVTNERVMIVSGLFSRKLKSLNLKTLTDVSLEEKSDGSGTITFGASTPMPWWSSGMAFPGWGPQSAPGFEMIQNAKQVYETIRTAQRQAN
jgi:hypothetical protein